MWSWGGGYSRQTEKAFFPEMKEFSENPKSKVFKKKVRKFKKVIYF